MSEAKRQLSIADHFSIELMRNDSDYDRYYDGVDDRVDAAVTAKFPKDDDLAALKNPWMPRLIALRAKLYCEEVLSIPVNQHVENLREWFVRLGLIGLAVVVFLGLATAIGGPKLFFDDQRNANISWLLLLMLGMFIISLLSAIGMVVMLVHWFRGGRQSNSAEAKKTTLVSSIVWAAVERARRLIDLIWGSGTGPSDDCFKKLKKVADRNSFFALAVSLLAINVYMLFVTLAIWGALYVFLFTNNVRYQFPNSMYSPQELSQLIAWFGRPVELIGRPVPTIDAIAWSLEEGPYRFDDSLFFRKDKDGTVLKDKKGNEVRWTEDEIASYKNARYGEFRRQWSKFLVGCVLVWLIAPRILVSLICGICVKCFYRDLLPSAEDEGVRKIVNQVTGSSKAPLVTPPSPPIPKPPVLVPDATPATMPLPADSKASNMPEPVTSDPKTATAPLVLPDGGSGTVKSVAKSKGVRPRFRIVGYELETASYDRLSSLARLLKNANVDQNLNGASEQMAFTGELHRDDGVVVVVASLLTTADDSFREFLEDVRKVAAAKVVLTDGTAAREEYNAQSSNFDLCLQAWKSMIRKAGLEENDILAHDLNNDHGVSLTASALDKPDSRSEKSGITIAAKYPVAIQIVRRHATSLVLENPQSQASALQNLDDELSRLYVSEKQCFADRLTRFKPTKQIQDALSKVTLPTDLAGECIRTATMIRGGLLGRLPTRWALAGGLSGLAVGTVGGLAAVATGGVAVLPMLLPIIVGHTISGASIGGGFKIWLDSKASQAETAAPSPYDDASDVTLVRCGVIQTLLYELQGNSESTISEAIGHVTGRLDQIDPHTPENLLTHFAKEMKEMEGQQ